MAFVSVSAGAVVAEQPLSDDLLELLKANQDWDHDLLTAGVSAGEPIVTDDVTIKGAGTALTVDNDSQFTGDVNIDGQLTTGSFFVSDFLQHFEEWA